MISIENLKDLSEINSRAAIKKPLKVRSWKIDEEFELKVEDINIKGYPGDYVIMTQHGYLYICNEDIFDEEYELID